MKKGSACLWKAGKLRISPVFIFFFPFLFCRCKPAQPADGVDHPPYLFLKFWSHVWPRESLWNHRFKIATTKRHVCGFVLRTNRFRRVFNGLYVLTSRAFFFFLDNRLVGGQLESYWRYFFIIFFSAVCVRVWTNVDKCWENVTERFQMNK